MHKSIFALYIFAGVAFFGVNAQSVTEPENVTEIIFTTTSVVPTTEKPTPNISCEAHNNDCKACVENSQCYYCSENYKCFYHVQKVVIDGECDMKHAYFLTCRANIQVIMIIIGVLSAVVLLIILIVCCYCCCKKKGIKVSKDDLKWARQREERKQIAAERRKERAGRTEEIRKKYGLVKDSNPYQKFDA